MKKLIIFDIDKTLIKSSPSRKVAFSDGFKKVYGVDADYSTVSRHGMTDQQIIIEVLKRSGIDEKIIIAKLKECMDIMSKSYEKNNKKDEIILFDDVKKTLDALSKNGNILGLATGNLESIAWSKLKKAGINKYFSIGGFGSDDANKTNIAKIAIKKAEEKFNIKFEEIFLVGDSPQDITAGKGVNIKTIGVTTSIYNKEDLERAGADYVVPDLKRILEVI